MIKFLIAWFVMNDAAMFCLKKDQGAVVKNMSIIEDLGQLHYIFTDKTGTLTCNEMEFKAMCIGQTIFGEKKIQESVKANTSAGNTVQPESGFDQEKFA